jgi:Subtilisin inhibitor-like
MGVTTLLVAAALAQTSLTVTVWPQGRDAGQPLRWTLRCDPVAGTLPTRGAACARLARLGSTAFAAVPQGAACSQEYGGPEDAVVAGRLEGRRVWARFRRRNGCEIARWKRHDALFPVGGDR